MTATEQKGKSKMKLISPFVALATFAAMIMATPALVLAGPGTPGHDHSHTPTFGEPGDPKKPTRLVNIVMRDADGNMQFIPNSLVIRKGEQVKFRIANKGSITHEFVLGTLDANLKHAEEMVKNPDMEHDDPNAKRIEPANSNEIIWKFTTAGQFDYSCLIPGHRESGMFGTIVVN